MAPRTIQYTGELVVTTCWCGTRHGVPKALHDYQERCHNNNEKVPDIYCPLGHAHVPSGTPQYVTERQAREAAEARATSLADQLAAADRERTRLAKRAKAGVCPCCKRSFVNVKRHMDSQHPNHT